MITKIDRERIKYIFSRILYHRATPELQERIIAIIILFISFILCVSSFYNIYHEHFGINDKIATPYNNYLQSSSSHSHSHSNNNSKPLGLFVLGMHRSGTSLLTGLLVEGLKFEPGEPLLPNAPDNPKGFYERIDVMELNDIFLAKQGLSWDSLYLHHYDEAESFQHVNQNDDQQLQWLDNVSKFFKQDMSQSSSWIVKDPRNCVTFSSWMNFLQHKLKVIQRPHEEIGIVFTYRHPYKVAKSLQTRDNFTLIQGYQLWLDYNIQALKNSKKHRCRVVTSNEELLENTLSEMNRLTVELQSCNIVKQNDFLFNSSIVDTWVNTSLQHYRNSKDNQVSILTSFTRDCHAFEYKWEFNATFNITAHVREKEMYLLAMKLYCDLQSRNVFQNNYDFTWLYHVPYRYEVSLL